MTVARLPRSGASSGLLRASVDELWNELSGMGPLIVQVRHRYARLIARQALPALASQDEGAGLACRPELFSSPVLRRCPCPRCACLPAVRIHDETAGECLQVCAPPGFPVGRWRRLERLFEPVELASLGLDESGGNRLRRLPGRGPERFTARRLPTFLAWLRDEERPVRVALHTPAVSLVADIAPRRFFVEQNVLTLGGVDSTLQIALPGLHGLALPEGGSPALHLVGPDDTSLLTLSPSGGRVGAQAWRSWFSESAD